MAKPEIGVWLDGAMPFRAETARGYVQGVHQDYLEKYSFEDSALLQCNSLSDIETRFRYNQDFKSIFAMVPGAMMLILACWYILERIDRYMIRKKYSLREMT